MSWFGRIGKIVRSAVKVGEGVSFLQEWTYLIGLLPDRAISVLVKEYKTRLHAMSQLHGGPAVSLDELDIICEGLRTRRDPESTLH